MLTLTTHWIWDFWLADTGTAYHLFFLKAPRGGDPNLRHWNTSVGHAVSADLVEWSVLADALTPSSEPGFDDLATWTGSVVRDDDGLWQMFYTGLSRADDGLVQRIGVATSPDLLAWTKRGPLALVTSDGRWYDQLATSGREEFWRDPWVMRDPEGDGWHMLITALANHGPAGDRGVIGHARSADLLSWEVQPPLTQPGSGFGQLEVPQVVAIEEKPLLLFNCLGPELSPERHAAGEQGGVWVVRPESLLGPYDATQATRLTDQTLYVGKLVQRRDGTWVLLAFINQDTDGAFVGSLSDPLELPQPLESEVVTAPPIDGH